MAIQQNSELDAQQLSDKLRQIDAHRRQPGHTVAEQTAFERPAAPPSQPAVQPLVQPGPVEPAVAPAPAWAELGRWQKMLQPGLSLRQRLRLVPVLGYGLSVAAALKRLPLSLYQLTLRLDELQREQQRMHSAMTGLVGQIADSNARIAELEALRLAPRMERQEALDAGTRLMKLESIYVERQLRTMHQLLRDYREGDAQRQEREVHLLARMTELERCLREHGVTVPQAAPALAPLSASAPDTDRSRFYVEFEAKFRGSRDDIKSRLREYLPYLAHIAALPPPERLSAVDVGCGRGEWLELMDEQGIPAVGIDMNGAMVDACIAQGLAARQADAVAYLRSLPAGSVSVVTGFHIIEHLPFEVLLDLFDAALHALCPGGVLIFETPNPENLQVGACNFYYDPTHLNPIVPYVAEFMARQRGFAHAEILRLHPYPDDHRLHGGTEVEALLNKTLYGPQDYAVIGKK